MSTGSNTELEHTEVLRGKQNVMKVISDFISSAGLRIDACVDDTGPSSIIENERLMKLMIDAKARGVRFICITQITSRNITYCKALMKIVDALNHLDGIKGNLYLSEMVYLSSAVVHDKGKPADQIIYSNVQEIVQHQQYIFETLWHKSRPARDKMLEIANGGMIWGKNNSEGNGATFAFILPAVIQ